MNLHQNCEGCLSRRRLLVVGAAGAAVALTGCSTYGDAPAGTAEPAPAANSAGQGGGAAARIATLADIPVGGAKIVGAVVLTQPIAGTVKAFSTTCTHAGCAVNEIADGTIKCPCHGSAFNFDGSVANGPAARPLAPVSVAVAGEAVTLA